MLEQYVGGIADVDRDPDRVESRSLYVKNLSFKTSDESLKKHFSEKVEEGKLLSVKVKKHLKNGKNISIGLVFRSLILWRQLQMFAGIYRELFWTGTLLFCNFVMTRRMKCQRKLTRIKVLQNYL